MKMFYYRGSRPNFGDELNVWLWPQLLPHFFDDDERDLFVGIGSTLFDFLPRDARKIVVGAGYGGYTKVPVVDDRWRFYFVRGRLTAAALGIDEALGIGDAGILVRSCTGPVVTKKHRVSFMPHWESASDGDWARATREAGLHYIDPCGSVVDVLEQIQQSEMLISEAMHGAIVADALRVPWIPIRPIQPPNRDKWHDWASALDLVIRWERLSPSNGLEMAMSLTGQRKAMASRLRKRGQPLRRVLAPAFRDRAVRSLLRVASCEPSLSADAAISRAHERMVEALGRVQADFGTTSSRNAWPASSEVRRSVRR